MNKQAQLIKKLTRKQATIECDNCNHINPADLLECEDCGRRLN